MLFFKLIKLTLQVPKPVTLLVLSPTTLSPLQTKSQSGNIYFSSLLLLSPFSFSSPVEPSSLKACSFGTEHHSSTAARAGLATVIHGQIWET